MAIHVPRVFRGFHDAWEHHEADYVSAYTTGETSFIPNLVPETALGLSADRVLTILKGRLGDRVDHLAPRRRPACAHALAGRSDPLHGGRLEEPAPDALEHAWDEPQPLPLGHGRVPLEPAHAPAREADRW